MQHFDDVRVPATLSAGDCWQYLREALFGRLAVVVDGSPEIFPINFVVDHGSVVFRTAEGTKLSGALAGAPVAFEVDGYDDSLSAAWSVVLKGTASPLQSIDEVLDSANLELFPWQTGEKNHFVRIDPTETTGRRFIISDAARRSVARARRRFTE